MPTAPRKPPLQDIVSRQTPPMRGSRSAPPPPPPVRESITPPPPPSEPITRRMSNNEPPYRPVAEGRKKKSFFGVASIVVGLLILVLGAGAVFMFSGAEISVVPKEASAFIDGTVTGTRSGAAASSTPVDALPFDILTIEETATKSAPATGEETASVPASGTIVIYNNYSKTPQKLIKNTRFETPDGLIFRVRDSVTVPGQTEVDGKKAAGSVEAVVYADEAGEKYNIGLTDFTVPGFKGSPQYEGFYARSKTTMTGGFVGTRKTVSTSDAVALRTALEEGLRTSLTNGAKGKVPSGFVMPEKSIFVTFAEPTQSSDGSNVTFTMKATLHGVIVGESELARVIAKKNVPSYDDSPVTIKDISALSVTPVIPENATDPWNATTLDFVLKGNVVIAWIVDSKRLAADLAGKSEEALNTVLTGYPGVARAKAILRPIWRSTFPTNPDEIKVTFEEPEQK